MRASCRRNRLDAGRGIYFANGGKETGDKEKQVRI